MPNLVPEPPLHLPQKVVLANSAVVSQLENFGNRAREIVDEVRSAAKNGAVSNTSQILLEAPDVVVGDARLTINYRKFTITFFDHNIGNNLIIGTPAGEMIHAMWRKPWLGLLDTFEQAKKLCKFTHDVTDRCSKEGLTLPELEALFKLANAKFSVK